MLTFRKILFPVDLSQRCIDTAPYVAAIARKFESEVFLLHVFSIYDGGLPYGAHRPRWFMRHMRMRFDSSA